LKEIAAEIEKETPGVKVLPVKLDVSKEEEVAGLVESLPQEWRDIDVLVNNAYVPYLRISNPNTVPPCIPCHDPQTK
jgi:NADP-dependent 3-hydroxy acid dehydrogenase YdfG